MIHAATIYGFGSYFERRGYPFGDIDLLVVHADLSAASIDLALECKRDLAAVLPNVHITVLSHPEEAELRFLEKSRARLLGTVITGGVASGVHRLKATIDSVR